MDRSLIKSMMPSLVAGHVPRNVRSFKYRVFDDQPLSSTLGFAIDPSPSTARWSLRPTMPSSSSSSLPSSRCSIPAW
jgi:hypothetical protein